MSGIRFWRSAKWRKALQIDSDLAEAEAFGRQTAQRLAAAGSCSSAGGMQATQDGPADHAPHMHPPQPLGAVELRDLRAVQDDFSGARQLQHVAALEVDEQ